MIAKPTYSAQHTALKEAVERFLAVPYPKTVEEYLLFLNAVNNATPVYRGVGGHSYGVHQSDFLRIMRDAGIPGEYETLIARAEDWESTVR